MRWGIPSDAHEYHGTTELCLNEINNCKAYSIGPNFVVLPKISKLFLNPTKVKKNLFRL